MPNIGLPEMLIVLVIALLVLGPKKLPEAGRSLGKGMREFKDSLSGFSSKDDDDDTGLPALEETTVTAASTTSTPASSTPSEPSSQQS
jgi:sec-independent protein translocase protein TatA